MSSPFVGEIRIFTGNYAPTGWALCDGQLLSISQNTALFSLLGTFYGGDGKTTFALPDLQGRVPLHSGSGSGPGLSQYILGEQVGTETVTLLDSEMPSHGHNFNAYSGNANAVSPTGAVLASSPLFKKQYYPANSNVNNPPVAPDTSMSPNALSVSGGSQPHNNMQPYLCLNFIIALQGVYPPRS